MKKRETIFAIKGEGSKVYNSMKTPTAKTDDWERDYYNFLVNNGMTKHTAEQGIGFVRHKILQTETRVKKKMVNELKSKVWDSQPTYNEILKFLSKLKQIK